MIFVDSGYLIALGDPRDFLHRRAVGWFRNLHRDVLLTEYVLFEAVNSLSTPALRQRAAELIEWARIGEECVFLEANRALFDAGRSLFRARSDKAWSLTDCISFHVMQERGIREALAHDEHFEQAGFVALLRRDP